MNLSQLEYIIALDEHRHFAKAADYCHVTQPTLSMMIRKLEQELDVILFDRSKKPVIPTGVGELLVRQARQILRSADQFKEIARAHESDPQGDLKLAVIPTLAPYLVPRFLHNFLNAYPNINLQISEMKTTRIIDALKSGRMDVGLLISPVGQPNLQEQPMFYEEFFVYLSSEQALYEKSYVLADDIDVNELWLLEEGHCFHSQILNLCELKKKSSEAGGFTYEVGSIETLKKIVETHSGITILPEFATHDLSAEQREMLRPFADPVPVREVSLAVHRSFVKQRQVEALKEQILRSVPEVMQNRGDKMVIDAY